MKFYNTLTRQKEDFVPIKPPTVKMYSCGPTVYDYFHIGNARPFIVFDAIRNFLEYIGYKVTFVQNFTDIDDKTINRSRAQKITLKELCTRYIDEYYVDARKLNIRDADVHPKATENIEEIIEFIEQLEKKDLAYNVNGDVYYSTRKFKDYGHLSHQDINDLDIGARVDVNENKRDPLDFVLWKKKKENEPSWPSKWGDGRPGWHIECSAMATKFLGPTIDIHCGGQDLIFPHHENEIAQSEGVNNIKFAKYWLHNGYINIDNKKMSKSENNFITVRRLAEEFGYEPIRMTLLSAHYRNPINFSSDLLNQSRNSLNRLYNCVENLRHAINNATDSSIGKKTSSTSSTSLKFLDSAKDRFILALEDDFNTAIALSIIFDLVKEINNFLLIKPLKCEIQSCLFILLELCDVLGLLRDANKNLLIDHQVDKLIKDREEARKNKDFVLADNIRDNLKSQGIILEDTKYGIKWKRDKER